MAKDLVILPDDQVDFRLFGVVEAYAGEQRIDLGSEKERCLFVALALANGQPVSRLDLPEWLWDEAPDSAPGDIDKFMTKLRNRLDLLGIKGALDNRDRLCRLRIPAGWIDVHHFRELVGEAGRVDDQRAAELLGEAVALSTGEPLAGLSGRKIDMRRHMLAEERRSARVMFAALEIRLGRHRERIADLTLLFDDRPDDTEVAGLTMYALHLAGRKPEALEVFARYRRCRDEIGVEVPRPMEDLHVRILREDDLGPEPEAFPVGGPARPTTEEPSDEEPPPARSQSSKVINKINGPVTGDNIVFGIQHQTRR